MLGYPPGRVRTRNEREAYEGAVRQPRAPRTDPTPLRNIVEYTYQAESNERRKRDLVHLVTQARSWLEVLFNVFAGVPERGGRRRHRRVGACRRGV